MGADAVWTGTWETNYGNVELQQTNDAVTGVYALKQGRINGRVLGDRLAGEWSEEPSYAPPDNAGEFEICLDLSGSSFKGKWWKLKPGSEHEWHGTKV